jgi:DNA invertase Pin-like site-specific DNA recombinase
LRYENIGYSCSHLNASVGHATTSKPAGKLLFQITGAFAEFERSMIRQRVNAGLARTADEGTRLGRPAIDPSKEQAIREVLAAGDIGMLNIAAMFGVGSGTVQRIKAGMKRSVIDPKTEQAIQEALAAGHGKGVLKIAAAVGVGSGTVQRIKGELNKDHAEEPAADHHVAGAPIG